MIATPDRCAVLKDSHIYVRSIKQLPKNIASLTLSNCTSERWRQIADALTELVDLDTLRVHQCEFTDILTKLSNCRSLRRLSIQRCNITEADARMISSLKKLEELNIDDDKAMTQAAYEKIINSMVNLQKLKMLSHNVKHITVGNSRMFHSLGLVSANLPNLTGLNIQQTQVSSDSIGLLTTAFPFLSSLSINRTNIGQGGLFAICCGLRLHTLNISSNEYGDEGAVTVARLLPHLTLLKADQCSLGWEAIGLISSNLAGLEKLMCAQNEEISKGPLTIGRLAKLKYLVVKQTQLKACTLVAMAGQLKNLKFLSTVNNNVSEASELLIRMMLSADTYLNNSIR